MFSSTVINAHNIERGGQDKEGRVKEGTNELTVPFLERRWFLDFRRHPSFAGRRRMFLIHHSVDDELGGLVREGDDVECSQVVQQEQQGSTPETGTENWLQERYPISTFRQKGKEKAELAIRSGLYYGPPKEEERC